MNTLSLPSDLYYPALMLIFAGALFAGAWEWPL